jgi:predicted GIY-YIG superfamily endonuclease
MGIGGAVYIFVNAHHTVFYAGVTADLYSRTAEHEEKLFAHNFTSKHTICNSAIMKLFIQQKKQLQAKSRSRSFPE